MFKCFVIVVTSFCLFFGCINSANSTTNGKSQQYRSMVKFKKPVIWGPGLTPSKIRLPMYYFFVNAIESVDGKPVNPVVPVVYDLVLRGQSRFGPCRIAINQLYRRDATTVVRYKLGDVCRSPELHVMYNGEHIGDSPYTILGEIEPEHCNCPRELSQWLKEMDCPIFERQIYDDLKPFSSVNLTQLRDKIIQKFNQPSSISLCNYVVKNNEIYRKCYGQFTGFKMFMDATLASLVKRVKLPDMEFFLNLGDWPLMKKNGQARTTGPYPIFSWCGSEDSFDIVLPTYDLTESTVEGMGKITLDTLYAQYTTKPWNEKYDKAFWRGRDSRRERLKLVDIARENPDLFNVSLTNFFFYRDEEAKYGPKVPQTPFLDFFDYKYQISIDGTVASYRVPYLLGGSSVMLKQKSPFYEHFYSKLIPYRHYIPFERDLSDLVKKLKWAMENEEEVLEMIKNANQFVNENLLPQNIYCYHVLLFKKWSEKIVDTIRIQPDMEKVNIQSGPCDCPSSKLARVKDEL